MEQHVGQRDSDPLLLLPTFPPFLGVAGGGGITTMFATDSQQTLQQCHPTLQSRLSPRSKPYVACRPGASTHTHLCQLLVLDEARTRWVKILMCRTALYVCLMVGLFGVAHLDEKGHSSDCLTRIFRKGRREKGTYSRQWHLYQRLVRQ